MPGNLPPPAVMTLKTFPLIPVILLLASPACDALATAQDAGIPWERVGKVAPRHAKEIIASNLWIGGEALDRDYGDYSKYKSYLGPLGAKKIRLQSGWAKTEKTKGVCDFAWLDAVVNDALSQGVQPWIQTSYGNPIYEGGGTVDLAGGIPSGEEALAAWERYVRALVTHFKGRVHEWEVWNESDLGDNIKKPEVYSELFYRTGKIIREIDPKATIVALSMAAMDPGYLTSFMEYLEARDAVSLVDVVTFHGYPSVPESNFEKVGRAQALIWKYKPGVRFWQGETGCPSTAGSSGALSHIAWNGLTQAKWNLRRALAHIGRDIPFSMFLLCEYSYTNHPDYVDKPKLNTKGLLGIDEKTLEVTTVKPAYYAYQNLCSMFDASAVLQKDFKYATSSDYAGLFVYGFKRKDNGRHAVTVWFGGQTPSDENTYRTVTLGFETLEIKKPVYVDIRTGRVFKIPAENFKRNKNDVTVTVPAYDCPCVIADEAFLKITK
ncbi:MAG: hypothetical protein LBM04_13720 [Opitutaceae bacterium]|jgi:hypothetical protein|nr:hypothetical protein [Opitutaceae bacterium]